MSDVIRRAAITETPIDETALVRLVEDASAGAVVTFSGVVRNHDHGRAVRALHYEAHPSAPDVVQACVVEVASQHELVGIAVEHRIGDLAIGDAALVVCVSAAHREAAFAACSAAVDLVKERLPVWKHQWFTDGTDEWVNCA